MLHKPRNSLPINIYFNPSKSIISSRKQSSVDIQKRDLVGNRKFRVQKLQAIINSTRKYNNSLKNLRQSWTRTSTRNSSHHQIPAKHDQVHKLSHYMKTTLIIFSELFAKTRNKKEILKKLHGWEDQFQNYFFDQNDINLKKLNKNELIYSFGLDKKTAKSATYYNKLKLLIEEINRTNQQRYNLLSQIQLSKISQKLQMIQEINDEFKRTYHGKDKQKYESMVHKTIQKISGFKSRMWSTCQAVKFIEQKTGPIEINWFLRNQQKKLQHVENIFLKKQKY